MKRRYAALASSIAVLALAACATMPGTTSTEAASGEPSGTTVAGRYLAAKFAASAGDAKGAASFYAETLKEDPENRDFLVNAFMYAAESGDVEGAVALTDRVLAKDPENRPARLIRQAGAFMRKDYLGVAKDADPSSQGAFSLLTNNVVSAWAIAGTGEIDGALTMLDGLMTQRGVDGLRLMHKALILDFAARDQDADAAYRQALQVAGNGPRIADAYGRFLVRRGRIEDAKALYTRVAADNPGHPMAPAALRDIDARRTFQPLISSPAEGVAEALFGIAVSLNDRRTADVAVLYLNVTLYLRPNFDLARVLLANHYEREQRFEAANAQYSRIQPASPYFAMTQIQAAINDGRMGRPESGVAKLRAIVERGTADPDAWTALGDLLRGSDRFADSIAAYDKAIAAMKDDDRRLVQLYYTRGISLERVNRWNDAERDFRQALRLNPERADVLNYLGYTWVDRGVNLQEAVSLLEKARALRPLDGFIADSVGWAYYKIGRYQEAARTLEEAVQLAPGASDVNDHLGDAYWRIGRKIDARFQWQHALALDPDQKQKDIIERKIRYGLDAVAAATP